ncbi:MAG: methyltransferase regulatory domain-containing protein [Ramlibacter sp.]
MKRDWSDGYVADITYSHGYFHELSPSYLRWHLLVNGQALPSDGGAYTYCELGYGQGVSANLHAAANPRGEFWGTDFNPDHALYARAMARQSGVNAQWLDLSFEAMLDTPTPPFDFIVLHGVWSWVSPAAQHALVEFMRRKLKPGGAVFMSYNVLPGWNAEKPLRDLLYLHTEHAGAPDAPTPARIAQALKFAQSLRRHGSAFFTENTRASQALDDMLRQDPGSLAHEYFNQSWCLSYFAQVQQQLQAARLNFACSVHLSDVAGEVRDRLAGAGFIDAQLGAPLRETAADFVLNRRFRRDVFTRGSMRLDAAGRQAALDEVKFVLARPAADVQMFLSTPYGKMALDEARLRPLLERLAAAQQPLSLAALRADTALADWPVDDLVLNLSRLVARRDVCPVFADDAQRARDAHAQAFNEVIARQSLTDNTLRTLASPVAGSGIDSSRLERLFWLAWQGGARSAAELGRAVTAEGAPAATLEEHEQQAEHFVAVTVPVWQRLGLLANRAAKPRK